MIKKITAVLFLCLITAFVAERFIAIQSNTLASQQSWYSLKKLSNSYFLGFMGADDFLFERQSLAGQNLNLGVWFGYQDVLYKKPLPDFKEYSVDFNLESEQSYIHIYLNCDKEKCWAFRASANPEYPTGLFLISNTGEFLRRIDLGSAATIGTGHHNFKIKHLQQDYEMYLNDVPYSKFEYAFEHKPIRFMGGFHPTSISKISYIDVGGKKSVINFKAPFSYKTFGITFLILLIISGFIILSLRKTNTAWNSGFACLLTFFILSSIFYLFDNYYWSHLYVSAKPNPANENNIGMIGNFENFRKNLFISQADVHAQDLFLHQHIWFEPFQSLQQKDMGIGINDFQIIDTHGNTTFRKDISEDLKRINKSNYLKIAFAGGSQTWGTGATRLNKTWPALIVQKLAEQTNRNVIGINFSICGGILYNFIQRADLINEFRPDLFILNFGANDWNTPDIHFKFQLQEFAKKINLQENNILVSIEAKSYEDGTAETKKAPLIRQFAEENKLPLVSLHDYYKSPEVVDSGNMWHDQLHFTDFGHIQTSRFFTKTDSYKKLLRNLNKSAGN